MASVKWVINFRSRLFNQKMNVASDSVLPSCIYIFSQWNISPERCFYLFSLFYFWGRESFKFPMVCQSTHTVKFTQWTIWKMFLFPLSLFNMFADYLSPRNESRCSIVSWKVKSWSHAVIQTATNDMYCRYSRTKM